MLNYFKLIFLPSMSKNAIAERIKIEEVKNK